MYTSSASGERFRRRRARRSTGTSVGLSAFQVVADSAVLGLLFPWRVSAILVPICSVFVFWRGLVWLASVGQRRGVSPAVVRGITAVLVAGGIIFSLIRNADYTAEYARESGLMDYVQLHSRAGEIYLVPPSFQYFRLNTGAAIVADREDHPYHAPEVLEWYRRLQLTREVQETIATGDCEAMSRSLESEPVTHVVALTGEGPACPDDLKQVFSDSDFTLNRVR